MNQIRKANTNEPKMVFVRKVFLRFRFQSVCEYVSSSGRDKRKRGKEEKKERNANIRWEDK